MTFEDALYEVLQTRRYDRLTGRTRDLQQIVADFIERAIISLLDRLNLMFPQGGGNTRVIPIIFAAIGGILLLTGIIVLVRMFIHSRRPKTHDLSELFEELVRNKYTVAGLLALSREAGCRRIAVRYRYIAALLALNEKEIIRIRPSATNALILRELKVTHPELAKFFADMANLYHWSWFGNKPVDDGNFALFCVACDVLIGEGHD
jgi:hypothetical protein